MNEAFAITEAGQAEVFVRQLGGRLPDNVRVQEIGRLSTLATQAKQRGDLQSALELEESALAICRELRSSEETPALLALTAAKLYNIGRLHYEKKEFDAARISFENARVLDAASGNIVGQAADYRGLAFIKQDAGDPLGAVELHQKALELDRRGAFAYGISTDEANIGANYLRLADPVTAKKYLLDALSGFDALGKTHEAGQVRAILQAAKD